MSTRSTPAALSLTALSPTAVALAALVALTGCVPNATSAASTELTVDSSAAACSVSAAEAPSGTISFAVTNSGDQVTEFYLLGDDGLRIVAEAENIGPGISRTLVVQLSAGDYFTVCKPGMVGTGVGKASFTVVDSATPIAQSDKAEAIAAANANYPAYVGAGLFA